MIQEKKNVSLVFLSSNVTNNHRQLAERNCFSNLLRENIHTGKWKWIYTFILPRWNIYRPQFRVAAVSIITLSMVIEYEQGDIVFKCGGDLC